jgi:hypothetical protein
MAQFKNREEYQAWKRKRVDDKQEYKTEQGKGCLIAFGLLFGLFIILVMFFAIFSSIFNKKTTLPVKPKIHNKIQKANDPSETKINIKLPNGFVYGTLNRKTFFASIVETTINVEEKEQTVRYMQIDCNTSDYRVKEGKFIKDGNVMSHMDFSSVQVWFKLKSDDEYMKFLIENSCK